MTWSSRMKSVIRQKTLKDKINTIKYKYMTIISVNMYKQFALMTQYIIMYTIDTSAQRSYLRIRNYDNYWVVIEDNKDKIMSQIGWSDKVMLINQYGDTWHLYIVPVSISTNQKTLYFMYIIYY